MNILVFCSVVGVGAGIAMLVASLRSPRVVDAVHRRNVGPAAASSRVTKRWGGASLSRRVVLPVFAGGLAGALTRWPVAAVAATLAVAAAPRLVSRDSARDAVRRAEAIASWTELLRDSLAASAGLGQAIGSTVAVAPAPVRQPVARLADRLATGMAMEQALRMFAAELADPSGDVVVCALLLAARAKAQRLADLLGALAESIREDASLRLRIEAGRASAKSGVRTIVVFSVLFAGALALLARSYLAPFGSTVGECFLGLVVACYAAGIALMVRMVEPPQPVRMLDTSELA